MQRTDHTIIESLDAILLLLADLGLGFDNVPKLDDVILNLLNVDRTGYLVCTHHLFDVCLELPVDFKIDYLTLLGDFGVRCSGESD